MRDNNKWLIRLAILAGVSIVVVIIAVVINGYGKPSKDAVNVTIVNDTARSVDVALCATQSSLYTPLKVSEKRVFISHTHDLNRGCPVYEVSADRYIGCVSIPDTAKSGYSYNVSTADKTIRSNDCLHNNFP